MTQDGLALTIAEALPRDAGRGVVRIDPEAMQTLGVELGSVVEVRGKRAAYAKVMPTFQEQRGRRLAQVDGLLRENAGCGIGDEVRLSPAVARAAERIVLQPIGTAVGAREDEYVAKLLDGLPVQEQDRVRATLFGSRWIDFRVVSTVPKGVVTIQPTTRLSIEQPRAAGGDGAGAARISYEDIGGLGRQLDRIREMIELPLRHPQLFHRLGITPPKGVLLYGPPGTGKTLIARAVASEADAHFQSINGPEIVHKFYGESEAHLRQIFETAAKHPPAIIFLDEIDAIAPKRDKVVGEVEKRIVAQLLALMDGLGSRGQVMVIAATNLPNSIDPALRRPGRFDREIEIPIPDRHGRRAVLEIHSRGMPLAADVDLDRLAEVTHGFVGADLAALCREAAMTCLRGLIPDIDLGAADLPFEKVQALTVTMAHFLAALEMVEPSAVREIFTEIPDVRWDDVGGHHQVKRALTEAVLWPLQHRAWFERGGIAPPKGLLLAGPPGTGKTLLAKALAAESGVNFISVKGPQLMSMYVGESERAVREVFHKARQAAPCIMFFDELDSLLPRRGSGSDNQVAERVVSQFLSEMDGIEELRGVFVLGATNRAELIDPAVLRPGRFDRVFEVPPPDRAALAEIFGVHTRGKPLARDVDLARLVAAADGLTGAQVEWVCGAAVYRAIGRALEAGPDADPAALTVTMADFVAALAEICDLPVEARR